MSGASSLDNTKTVLKALIVSSPKELTIRELCQDYLNQEGTNVPFAALGYRSMRSFISSMPDILTVNPHTGRVTIVGSNDNNSAHVLKMVTEQKPVKSRSNRGNRLTNSNQFNDLSHSNNNQHNNRQPQTLIWDCQPPMVHQKHLHNEFERQRPQSANQMLPKRFEPGNLLAPPNTYNIFHNKSSLLGMPSHIPSLFDIPQAELAMGLCSLNGHSRHSNRQKKENVKKQSTPVIDVEQTGSKNVNGHADTSQENNCDLAAKEVAALPPMDDDDPIMFIGSKMRNNKYGKSIPPAAIPANLKAGDVYQICVTEITSMPHFFFQFYDTRNVMSEIDQQLRWCYDDQSCHRISTSQIQVGNVCAALYRNKWLRAEILTTPDDGGDHVKLLFVDFATIDYVSSSNINYLQSELCDIPRLCHRGALAFLGPLSDYKSERKIIKIFCEMVTDKSLMAVMSDVDESDTISMTLVDTSSADVDVIVNKILLEVVDGSEMA